MKKTMKKLTCAVLAATCAFGCAATLTACESAHPKVEMEIEFNGETYTLEYELYRKIAPATVNHFLWLAGNGYYDGLCVHDYEEAKRMYTGAYSAIDDETTPIEYKNYFETIAAYANYGEFPHSTWLDEARSKPSYTLKGEFEDNSFKVTNGALQESFGSLSMYYDGISSKTISKTDVWTANAGEKDTYNKGDYAYNSTKSAFFISLTTTLETNNNYCTFATLDEDSQETLQNLQSAINDYISEHYADDDDGFTQEVEVEIFTDDALFEETTVEKTFDVPKQPITIKTVTVKKY